jgi:hypothetical protein
LAPVTPVSLRATDCQGVRDCMESEAGVYARGLWKLTYTVFALIAALTMFKYAFEFVINDLVTRYPTTATWASFLYQFSQYFVPFTYGTLGACALALRTVEKQFRDRVFDPRRVPQQKNRIVLGTLSGGVIVIFVKAGEGSTLGVELTAAALGFLAGYSSDLLFEVVDRILHSILPRELPGNAPVQPPQAVPVAPRRPAKSAAPEAHHNDAHKKDKGKSDTEKTADKVLKSIPTN